MINLSNEQKKLFYTSNFKDYVFYFPEIDLRITNDTIHEEAVTIKESICEEQEFTLGGCIASSIEFEVSEIIQHDLTGLEFFAELYVNLKSDGTYDLKIPMGVYRVDSAKMVDDKDYKKVVAYDALYDASIDVSGWYRDLFQDRTSIKLKDMRESLLEYLGMSYMKQTLINDESLIEKTIEPSDGSITGTFVLKAMCAVNGGFGRINREGMFEVIHEIGLGLFPEDSEGQPGNAYPNVYPEETLYPEDHFQYIGMSEGEPTPEYRTTKYEEYTVRKITCVNIQTTEEDFGVTYGDDLSNPYLITGNFLLYGKGETELKAIAKNILSKIKDITYRPNTTTLDGLPYMEVGDVFALEKRTDDIESYIFKRALEGVQGLKDTYEAKGNEIRANEVSESVEITQLKGKTLILKKSIEGVSSELTDLEKSTSSRFDQTNTAISAEVTRATEAEGKLSGKIEVTADSISAEVTRATDAEEELKSSITQTAEEIRTEISDTANELQSSIDQTSNEIVMKVDSKGNIVEVALGKDADDESKTIFYVKSDNISLTANDVIDMIAGGNINLTSKKIAISSDNFNVDQKGNVTASSLELTGGGINMGEGVFTVDDNGNVTASSIDINGGRINLQSSPDEENSIFLQYLEDAEITRKYDYYGYGEPDIRVGDTKTYVDLNTKQVYISVFHHGSWNWQLKGEIADLDETRRYSSVYIAPQDGIEIENQFLDESGHIKKNVSSYGIDAEIQGNVTCNTLNSSYIKSSVTVHSSMSFTDIMILSKNSDWDDTDSHSNPYFENIGGKGYLDLKGGNLLGCNIPILMVEGFRFVRGSVTRNFGTAGIGMTVFDDYVDAPNIEAGYPVSVCNGHYLANPRVYIENIAIDPDEQKIRFRLHSDEIIRDTFRVTYSYWAKTGE